MPLEKTGRGGLVPGVERGGADPRIGVRDGPPVRGRDLHGRHELEQVAHDDLGHGARGAEDRDPHHSSSGLMSGVSASTSLSVSSRAPRTSLMSRSGMFRAGSMRTTLEFVSVPATRTPRRKSPATTL